MAMETDFDATTNITCDSVIATEQDPSSKNNSCEPRMISSKNKESYIKPILRALSKDDTLEAENITREAFQDKNTDEFTLAWVSAVSFEKIFRSSAFFFSAICGKISNVTSYTKSLFSRFTRSE